MAKQAVQSGGGPDADTTARRKARRNGWFLIIAVSVATLLLFVLGTIDQSTRYDWIKL
ncbi:MAG: hypothetical protein MPJ78_12310 [Hyphomicrobiaceae bacterium]|nr:hypothetical protein [Hyphomicrobiaceae bacterium]